MRTQAPSIILNILILCCCLFITACDPNPRLPKQPLSTFFQQADPLIVKQRYAEAVTLLEEAAQLHPDSPLPLLKMGQIYLRQQRWPLAEDAFNRALARDLDNALATAGLAEAKLHQGELYTALKLWQQAAALDPTMPDVYTHLGQTHLLNLDFAAAKDAFVQQQTSQSSPEALWYLAVMEAPQDVTTANRYLLDIPPDAPPELLVRRDYVLTTLAPFSSTSSPAQVAKGLGIALAQAQQWPLAVHTLTQTKNSHLSPPEQAETLAFLGQALAQTNRSALELFEQAQQLDPVSALPAYFYGIYLRRKGALQSAEQLFQEALVLDPDNAAIQLELALTKTEQGDFIAAEEAYNTAVSLSNDDLQMQLARLRFYAGRGYRVAEAGIPAAEAIIKRDKNNAEAHSLLGWMHFVSADFVEAEAALQKALELDPTLVSTRYHLARTLEANGKPEDAKTALLRVVDEDTTGGFRVRALQDLQRLGP